MAVRRKFIFTTIKYLVVAGIMYSMVMSCFLGRLTYPTEGEYVRRAKNYIPLVQAIYDYQADHGVMPATLQDLAPDYMTWLPTFPEVYYNEGLSLTIRAHAPHTGIVYSFDPQQEGWSCAGEFGTGPLPLPKLKASRPPRKPVQPTTSTFER